MLTRPIPSTGEALPVVGLGTYRAFDVRPESVEYRGLPAVVDALFAAGGTLLDSSPMYGRADRTIGELLAAHSPRPKAFLATKVWTHGYGAGVAQMNRALELLRTDRLDLMQIHNLVDWQIHLPALRDWKAAGRIRYIGITHYTSSAYRNVEAVLRAEPLDFLQINYALDDRVAAERVLPLAAERGVAVMVNMPFGEGSLLQRFRGEPLPGWANEVCAKSWAQLALKFVLSHPAVTCVIPGTGNAAHMAENAVAAKGPLLSAAQIKELVATIGIR